MQRMGNDEERKKENKNSVNRRIFMDIHGIAAAAYYQYAMQEYWDFMVKNNGEL